MTTKLSDQLKKKRAKRKDSAKASEDTLQPKSTLENKRQTEKEPEAEIRVPAADIVNNYDFNLLKKLPYKEIEPTRCKPWDHHNRSQLWLTPEKARSLSDSIRSIGQQELGLVRPLDNDPDFDYEIIYGVRRCYACSLIPNQKFKAKVSKDNDTICAKLMHFENEESKDISEIEKALSYHHQIKHGLFKTQKDLARELQISESLLTRLLKAAKLFEIPVLDRLLSPHLLDLTIKSASVLYDLTRSPELKEVILEQATSLLEDQDALMGLSGKNIVQTLKRAAAQHQSSEHGKAGSSAKPYRINKMANGDFKIILDRNANQLSDQAKLHSLISSIVESLNESI